MARKKVVPEYGTIMKRGVQYYRTRMQDADGKWISLYAQTPEELYDKSVEMNHREENRNPDPGKSKDHQKESCCRSHESPHRPGGGGIQQNRGRSKKGTGTERH